MPIDLKAALEFIRDVIGKIMIVAGSFLLILAVALFSRAYQWLSAASFLFGVLLILVGIILHFESLTLKVPSLEGWGTILICISAMFMATAVVAFFFAVPGKPYLIPSSFRQGAPKIVVITLAHPNAWLTPILACIGVGFLALGVFLKFFRDIF